MVKIKDTHIPPGYKKTEVGVIPEEWEVSSMNKSVIIMSGGTPNTSISRYWGGDIFWVSAGDISNEQTRYIKDTERKITIEGLKNSPAKILPVGTIVIIARGATVGRIGQLGSNMAINQTCYGLIANNEVLNQNFLYYISKYTVPNVISKSYGTIFGTITTTSFKDWIIPLPPLPEQRAIARVLSDVDGLLEALDGLIEKKRALKTAAMQQLLTGKKRLPGFEGEWVKRKLGEVAILYQPETISSKYFKESGYPVYGANGIVGYLDKYNHDTWQVLVTCRGSTCGTINRTVERSWITGNAMVLNIDQNPNIDKEFFYYLMQGQDLSSCITGTGQPQIVRGPLSKFPIKFPNDKTEQRAIARVLSDMDAEIEALEARRKKVRQLKQGMMQVLLTGKVRLVGEKEGELQNT